MRLVGWVSGIFTLSLVAGCVAPAEPNVESPVPSNLERTAPPEMIPESVSDRVLTRAAADLSVPVAALSLLRVNQETWLDSCLGLGRLNESCLQALFPGWQVEVVYDDQSTFYRSDETGEIIRRSQLENNLPPSIATQVIDLAAAASDIPADQLAVTAAEPRVWDGCLGIAEPDTVCTQVAIFGWRAVVAGAGETLIYHTDMTGEDIRLNNLE